MLAFSALMVPTVAMGTLVPVLFADSEGKAPPPKFKLEYTKLGSELNRLIANTKMEGSTSENAAGEATADRERSVAVSIYPSGNEEDVVRFLQDHGSNPRNVMEGYVESYVPVGLLGPLSEQAGVERVKEIVPPVSTKRNYTSEGVALHLASSWHSKEYIGQGKKVGIIDNGFEGLSELMGRDLSTTVKAMCYRGVNDFSAALEDCNNSTPHDTATAGNVIDMVPEASLYITTDAGSYEDLQDIIEWTVSEGVSIIKRALFSSFERPGDGPSPFPISILSVIDRAVQGGALFVNSAGNSSLETWFWDTTPTIYEADGDGAGWVECADSDITNSLGWFDVETQKQRLPEGREAWAHLRWENSWTNAPADFDLCLIDSNSDELVARSEDYQIGRLWHIPKEGLYKVEIPRDGEYHLAIFHRGGALPEWIQLIAPKTDILEHERRGYSVSHAPESAYPNILAVGSPYYWYPKTIALNSSQGTTPDGRFKPDIVGATCGKTATYRPVVWTSEGDTCSYGGTSSASAHVSGLVALVKQRFPGYTPAQIASYLKRYAEQRGEDDPNNIWGHGLAVLPLPEPPFYPIVSPAGTDTNGPSWLGFKWEMLPMKREPPISFAYHLDQQTDEVRSTHSRGTIQFSNLDLLSIPHITITGLLAEQSYRFSVRAANVWGEGPYSEPVTREILAAVPSSAPVGLTAELSQDDESAVILHWDPLWITAAHSCPAMSFRRLLTLKVDGPKLPRQRGWKPPSPIPGPMIAA